LREERRQALLSRGADQAEERLRRRLAPRYRLDRADRADAVPLAEVRPRRMRGEEHPSTDRREHLRDARIEREQGPARRLGALAIAGRTRRIERGEALGDRRQRPRREDGREPPVRVVSELALGFLGAAS